MSSQRFKPNTTQAPNILFDDLMNILPNDEFKVLCAIIRKTYGWHKDTDSISNSQFEKMTGLSTRQIQRAKVKLKEKGLIAEHAPPQPWMAADYEFIPPVQRFQNPSSHVTRVTPPMTSPRVTSVTPPMTSVSPSKDYSSKYYSKAQKWAWDEAPEALRQFEPVIEFTAKFHDTFYFRAVAPVAVDFVESQFTSHGVKVKVLHG